MVKEKTVERLEKSAVKLSITVDQSDVRDAYDSLVAQYEKTAQIKGFRKGKVPRNVLERKFGESFRMETLENILDKALKEAYQEIEETPLRTSGPELVEEVDLDLDKDLTFAVKYDVYPHFEVGPYKGLEINAPTVTLTDEDIQRELENLRQQNALVMDKESETVETGDMVTCDFAEIDEEGNAVSGKEREDFSLTVGEGKNWYRFDEDLVGMKIGESKEITKTYPEDFEVSELAGSTRRIRVEIKSVRYRDVPELDDEFAQDVNDKFETLDDLREDVKKRLQTTADQHIRHIKVDNLMDRILNGTSIDLPESMVQSEIESTWVNFAEQYRLEEKQLESLLVAQGKAKAELFEEWRPAAEKRLRKHLIVAKLIDSEEITVTPEEAEEHLREQASDRPGNVDQIVEYYRNNGMLPYVQQELAEDRLFDKLLAETSVTDGDSINFLDLLSHKH